MLDEHLEDKLHNDELREDTHFGAFPCEITGEQDEDDPQYIEVILPGGREYFVRMCYTFPLVAVPTKEWLEKYKESIYCWVTFERGMPDRPIMIGFTFKEGAEHNIDSFPNMTALIGEKYQITIDDKEDSLQLKQLEDNEQEITITKDSVFIKSDNINLGEETGAEPSVLGDTLADLLTDLLDALSQGKVATSLGPQLFMPDTQAKLAQIKASIDTIKSDINKVS